MNRICILATGTAWACALATGTLAGDLNPPPGAVGPTMKTLSEVEPRIAINATNTPGDAASVFKITQPGSYYLTGNVMVPASRVGIRINSSNVTIDLNGFSLIGDGAGSGGIAFADQGGAFFCTTVRNGSVRGMGAYGVYLFSSQARGVTVQDLVATHNGMEGIAVSGGAVVRNCVASNNGANGIANGGAQNCVIENCVASNNAEAGITVGGAAAVVRGCTAALNGLQGIAAYNGATISECNAFDNSATGILASSGSTVTGCTSMRNALDGIEVDVRCRVIGNICNENGLGGDGAGINALGLGNRIEGNHCTNADRGIDVDGTGNVVIRNTCSGNTVNWSIIAGNAVGPIVQASVNIAPINGSTYAGAMGSTDSHANFTH